MNRGEALESAPKLRNEFYFFLKRDQLILIVAHVQGPHVLDLV